MIQTIEATIDENGSVHLMKPITLKLTRRALVTVLEEKPAVVPSEEALLSEHALARDWEKPEEEKAWLHLQSDQ